MKRSFFVLKALLLAVSLFANFPSLVHACSGYKVTFGGKTLMGANEDAWRTTPQIWFETATEPSALGAMFTGSRFDGVNGYAPQSGMNEAGLCFQRLAAPVGSSRPAPVGTKPIENQTLYLKAILHNCQTVEDVQAYIRQYRQNDFSGDVFLYVDKSGRYLTVEPYALTPGAEPKYVISNFCPSVTSLPEANRLDRFRNGVAFRRGAVDNTLAFCRALSDTMHVCRKRMGDGTLLTSIYELNAGAVNLYFYHDYQRTVRFNLQEELRKGNHSLAIADLFPKNKEFDRLYTYQTPLNNPRMLLFLLGCVGLFSFSALYFSVRAFRRKQSSRFWQLGLIPAVLFVCYYLMFLLRDSGPFFFAAPYQDPFSPLLSAASYLPFALVLAVFPLGNTAYRLFRNGRKSAFSSILLSGTILALVGLICLFGYWGFYNVV